MYAFSALIHALYTGFLNPCFGLLRFSSLSLCHLCPPPTHHPPSPSTLLHVLSLLSPSPSCCISSILFLSIPPSCSLSHCFFAAAVSVAVVWLLAGACGYCPSPHISGPGLGLGLLRPSSGTVARRGPLWSPGGSVCSCGVLERKPGFLF